MTNSDVLRLENYLRFHFMEIQDELRTNDLSESDRVWCAKWGSAATVLKEHLVRRHEEIRSALARIQKGTYGNCAGCGHEISQKRLEVVPWLKLCTVCQQYSDQQLAEHAHEPDDYQGTSRA